MIAIIMIKLMIVITIHISAFPAYTIGIGDHQEKDQKSMQYYSYMLYAHNVIF